MNAAERNEIVDSVVIHAADMQFRGQTHLIRIGIPSADVSRAELQPLSRKHIFGASRCGFRRFARCSSISSPR